jgi:hypothetical protein
MSPPLLCRCKDWAIRAIEPLQSAEGEAFLAWVIEYVSQGRDLREFGEFHVRHAPAIARWLQACL